MNFTVTSAGRQFDRLALMYLGDTEVWRTSTAEPKARGIVWTYWKDMTEYLALWKEPQKIIFDLGNLINDLYTGPFNSTLTATFFMAPEGAEHESAPAIAGSDEKAADASSEPESTRDSANKERRQDSTKKGTAVDGPADVIIPVSARKSASDDPSAWNLGETAAVDTISSFPRNARRAVFSVSANGQSAEEFWWSNLPESVTAAFNETAGMYYGLSPWREVQVFIDGKLAGLQWPFPVIFTGGVNPAFHRPVVAPDAFDLREHEIDITAWLPLLCDGGKHEFQIRVAGIDDTVPGMEITKEVSSYWVVSGKIFVWLDEDGEVTTGDAPYVSGGPDNVKVVINKYLRKNVEGFNETLDFEVKAERDFSVRGKIVTSKGEQQVRWSQSLRYKNTGKVETFGFDQYNDMVISGVDTSSGAQPFRSEYSYPLRVGSVYREDAESGNFSINATMYHGLDLHVEGASVFPSGIEAFPGYKPGDGSKLSTFRDGMAYIAQSGDGKSGIGYGNMAQEFIFGSAEGEMLYSRKVSAANDTVLSDKRFVMGGTPAEEEEHTAPAGLAVNTGGQEYAAYPGLAKTSLATSSEGLQGVGGQAAAGGSEVKEQSWLSSRVKRRARKASGLGGGA